MHRDFLIVGQGICGSFLSWYLQKAGFSVLVADDAKTNSASRIAAGVINPVTGRRIVKTWEIDQILPAVEKQYTEFGAELGITAIKKTAIADFFPTPQMKIAFQKRIEEQYEYISNPADENEWAQFIKYDFGFGYINPVLLVNLASILSARKTQLENAGSFLPEKIITNELKIEKDKIQYRDHSFSKIIFCDGVACAESVYFRNLPFAPNKGEVILAEIPDLPDTHIYKKGFNLAPLGNNVFWLGSSYLWEFDNELPTPGFYQFGENWLKQTVKLPYKIIEHTAGVRPATLERRPFVGFHPLYPNMGIFNGMGTKGCSLAPFLAREFVSSIIGKETLNKEVSIARFEKILSRQ